MKNSAYVTQKDRHANAYSMQGNEDGIVRAANRIEEPLGVSAPLRENNSSSFSSIPWGCGILENWNIGIMDTDAYLKVGIIEIAIETNMK